MTIQIYTALELKSCPADHRLVLTQKTSFFRQQRRFPSRQFWPSVFSKRVAILGVTYRQLEPAGPDRSFWLPLARARPVASAGGAARLNQRRRRPPRGTRASAPRPACAARTSGSRRPWRPGRAPGPAPAATRPR